VFAFQKIKGLMINFLRTNSGQLFRIFKSFLFILIRHSFEQKVDFIFHGIIFSFTCANIPPISCMKTVLISEAQSKTLLSLPPVMNIELSFNPVKNQVVFYHNQTSLLKFRMPISISSPEAFYNFPEDRANYVLIMIRSGIATVGYFEDGTNIDHKVFRAYMVRKKQGKSQIKYLKTKGKSRAGSRVRLAEALDFFEEINHRLQLYFKVHRIERIGLSCPVTLIPYFYGSKVSTPFAKGDERILKVPKHIQNPTFESLMK